MPQYLVLATDFTDADALTRRLAVRDQHLDRMRIEKVKGTFIIGGAKLNEQGDMYGSMLVINLESMDAVKEWLNEDPYITGKVWDHIEVIPFKVAGV